MRKSGPLVAVFATRIAICGILVSTGACSSGNDGNGPAPSNAIAILSIVPSSLTLLRGAKGQLAAEARSASGASIAPPTVVWASSDAAVATVSTSGEVTGVAVGSVTVSARAGTLTASAAISVRAPPTYTLTVATDSGVQGSPIAGTQTVDSGTTVAYAYDAKAGYQAPRVFLDTSRIAASGSIKINGSTVLVASADPQAILTAAARALVAPTRAILSSADPAIALGALESSYRAFVGSGDTANVRELEIVAREAFRDVSSAELTAFYRRLAARLRSASAVVRPQPRGVAPATVREPHVYFVNGVLTSPADAAATSADIATLAATYGYSASLQYNPTWYEEAGASWFNCALQTVQAFGWTVAFATFLTCSKYILDLAEAQAQIELVMAGVSGTQPFVAELRDAITMQVDAGHPVILVAHSQGNLMTQEALAQLVIATLTAFAPALGNCIGVVSIAAPLSDGFPSEFRVDGVIAAGATSKDVLLLYPGKNRFPTVSSSRTDTTDRYPSFFPFNYFLGIWIHVSSSYLNANSTRTWIRQHIGDVGQQLETRCTDVATATTSSELIPVGGSAVLSATRFHPTGNKVLGAEFTWTSSNAAIARVVTSPSVQVIGVSPGTVRIDAVSGEVSASIQIQVSGPPQPPAVTVDASDPVASEIGPDAGTFTLSRTGSTAAALSLNFTLTGTATNGVDYTNVSAVATIPIGQSSTTIQITPIADALVEGNETVILTLAPGAYTLGAQSAATVNITDGTNGSPGMLTNGESRNGSISSPGEVDTFTFTAAQGDLIALSIGEVVMTATLSPWIRLRSPAGVVIGQSSDFSATHTTATAPATGTYTVLVGSWDGAANSNSFDGTGSYVLTLVKAPGTFTIAPGDEGGPMTNGGNHTGTITLGDLDPWTLSATQGETIALSIGKVGTTPTLWPWIRLVSPSGAIIGIGGYDFSATQTTVTAPATGTYTVIVGSWDGTANRGGSTGTGSYVLSLVKAPGTFAIAPGDEGGPMTNGATHTGAIALGDVDPWTFTATQGEAIIVSAGKVVSTATLSPWIRLVSPTGTIIGIGIDPSATQIAVTAPASGTYTVIIGSWNGTANSSSFAGTGNYVLRRQ